MKIRDISKEDINDIMTWKYDKPYDTYSFSPSDELFDELSDGSYYSVIENELVGYVCFGKSAQVPPGDVLGAYDKDYIDIGLGLRPELCGNGLGKELISVGIDFANSKWEYNGLRLTVAQFNERAINLYKSIGFKDTMSFKRDDRVFVVMEMKFGL